MGQNSIGGAGGGVINVSVTGNLHLGAAASIVALGANGADGAAQTDGSTTRKVSGSGGGAGGSILIVAGSITGSGTISADGGRGGVRAQHYNNDCIRWAIVVAIHAANNFGINRWGPMVVAAAVVMLPLCRWAPRVRDVALRRRWCM